MDDLPPSSEKAARASALRKAVREAYGAVQRAHVGYEHALEITADRTVSRWLICSAAARTRIRRGREPILERRNGLARLYGDRPGGRASTSLEDRQRRNTSNGLGPPGIAGEPGNLFFTPPCLR